MTKTIELLIKPVITEKASLASEKFNRYTFLVKRNASKPQIREAIESFYDVKVLNIRTMVASSFTKKTMKGSKTTLGNKKAIVELAKGQKIEFFKDI